MMSIIRGLSVDAPYETRSIESLLIMKLYGSRLIDQGFFSVLNSASSLVGCEQSFSEPGGYVVGKFEVMYDADWSWCSLVGKHLLVEIFQDWQFFILIYKCSL